MNRTNRRRLNKLTREVAVMPIAPEAEDAAFERFCATGELPDQKRLAAAVCKRALSWETDQEALGAPDWQASLVRLRELATRLRETAARSESDKAPRRVPLRELLFDEAVYGSTVTRLAARAALRMLVTAGQEVTRRNFLDEDMELPKFGSLGLHLLGWPECLVRPPYEEQAQRVLQRLDAMRRKAPLGDEGWFQEFAAAAARFFRDGDLPEDELLCEAVLVYGEMLALARTLGGEEDPEVLEAYDEVGRAEAGERQQAIVRLQALAGEGRVP